MMLNGLGLVVQIMTAALKLRSTLDIEGLSRDDVEALGALQKALLGVVQTAEQVEQAARPPARMALEADGLLLAAFGEALGGYVHAVDEARTRPQRLERFLSGQTGGAHDDLPEGARVWGSSVLRRFRGREAALNDEIQSRLQAVLDRGGAGGDPAAASPLSAPLYRALRAAVSDPALGEPLVATSDLLAFDRDMLVAWQQRLARRADLRDWRAGTPEREARRLWELIAAEQADWGSRHVFGNLRPGSDTGGAAFLSLDQMYVEPEAVSIDPAGQRTKPEPVLTMLGRLVAQTRVVVVQADFGMGKSLTARGLTRDLSRAWIASGGAGWLPLYVRCADDLRERRLDIKRIIPAAAWRVLSGAGLELAIEDVPQVPLDGARALIVLDGLDEVELGRRDLDDLFKDLERSCTPNRHFVVLSRPGALPQQLPEHVCRVEIQPFDPPRIEDWLARWAQVRGWAQRPDWQALNERGLAELASTPVLLLMIAWTWTLERQGSTIGDVYERFMRALARGKCEQDRERHPVIASAAERLAERLCSAREIDRREPEEAMLWLLARAAWEARILAHERPPRDLDTHVLGDLIREVDRGLDLSALDAVKLGVLLALQVDPHGGTSRVLFGHRSFAEYLCARHWEFKLRRALRERRPREDDIKGLGAAPLALQYHEEDRAHEFVLDRFGAWPEDDRGKLHEWTLHLLVDPPREGVFFQQTGWQLRRSMVSVASCLTGWPGWSVRESDMPLLRALLWWPVVTETLDRLCLRKLKAARGSNLAGAPLYQADLSESELAGVSLSQADLQEAVLEGASLVDAQLIRTSLAGTTMVGIDLSGAQMASVDLFGSNLSNARLCGADLEGADLFDAELRRVDLTGANIQRCDLRHCKLDGAILTGANLSGARWSRGTLWPEGFTPPANSIFEAQ